MKIVNPATEEVIADIIEDPPARIAEKYARARRAQPVWARVRLADRLAALRRFGELVAARKDELALTLTREMGKPIKQSHNEIAALGARLDFFLERTPEVLADEVVLRESGPAGSQASAVPRLEERIAHEPLGVVANISAWNYPYFVGSNVFVPALLTGNSVLYKPSEHATLTGLRIAALLAEAGVTTDAFTAVVGSGTVGKTLLEHPVDGVFFTGSHATGRRIAESVAGRLIKVQLELGGKDPSYVCDDVDPQAAAASLADGAFYNTGQSCCSVERIYVHRQIAADFVEAFVEVVRGFVVGSPEDEKTYIGPLAREDQLAVLEKQAEDARGQGARVLCGGQRRPGRGFYFEPTVLVDVNHQMQVMREESFGPIIGIQTVKNDEEAVVSMNDTRYGLTAGVYSADRERAQAILRQVNAGSVYWNCCDRVSPRLPWSGRGHSGIGCTLSTHGIRSFVQPKAWHLRAPA